MNSIVTKQRQRGVSMFGLAFILALIAAAALITLRVLPMYSNYWTIVDIAEGLQDDGSLINKTKRQIRLMLIKRFRTNNLWDLKSGEVVKVSTDPIGGAMLHIKYEVRSPLIVNLEVIATFDKVISASQ